MSEDRTQSPSKLRREQARESGHVAHSPELTAAVGLLTGAALMGSWGGDLANALLELVREPLLGTPKIGADPGEIVAHFRHVVISVAWPLGIIAGGAAAASVLVHQLQVGGLWAPGLLAPDFTRLWSLGRGPGLGGRGVRGAWGWIKAVVIFAVASWVIRTSWPGFQRLGVMDAPELAATVGGSIQHLILALALAVVVLGLMDFAIQLQRFEAMLRMTPEEQREDQKSMEGDPALRARRRRHAKALRGDAGEILAGASLMIIGRGGLTVILTGGPPPRTVSVRAAQIGSPGLRLRREAESARLLTIEAHTLGQRIAGRRATSLPLNAEESRELAAVWPTESPRVAPTRGPHG